MRRRKTYLALIATIPLLVALMLFYLYYRTNCVYRHLGKDELAGTPGWQSAIEWDSVTQNFIYEYQRARHLGLGFYTFEEVYGINMHLDKTLYVYFCITQNGLNSVSARLYENRNHCVEINISIANNSVSVAERVNDDRSINFQKASLKDFLKTGALEGRTTACIQILREVYDIATEACKGLKTQPVIGWRPKFLFSRRREVEVTHLKDPFLEAETKAFSKIKAMAKNKPFPECYKYTGPPLP